MQLAMPESTINYTLQDAGDRFVITPRCYFDCKPGKTRVKLNTEIGAISIAPKKKPKLTKNDLPCNTSKMIHGGIVYLPKKADLTKDITIRHEGPVNQVLIVEIPKLAGAA